MSIYTIKVHDGLKGLETILMEDFHDYEVGQTILIAPKGPITVLDQHGNGVRLLPASPEQLRAGRPKMAIRGTVIEKRY